MTANEQQQWQTRAWLERIAAVAAAALMPDENMRLAQGEMQPAHISLMHQEHFTNLFNAFIASLPLAGDAAEFGVFMGGTAKPLAAYLKKHASPKKLWLLDSFRDTSSLLVAGEGTIEVLQRLLADYRGYYTLLSGDFSNWLEYSPLPQLCFAHIDTDLFEGTRDALKLAGKRVVKGGIISIHDYADLGWPGVS